MSTKRMSLLFHGQTSWVAYVSGQQILEPIRLEQSSLEFRLRDASHIRHQITRLLKDLDGILEDIKCGLSDDYVEVSGMVASSNDEDAWLDGEDSTSEIKQLYEEAVNVIDCLYKMSMLIRRPAQHDVLLGSHKSDAAAFEPFDREHVRNKFPDADNVTIQRLGRAITQRRKYLKYRGRHHAKLGKGIDEGRRIQGAQGTVTQGSLSETIATNFQDLNIDFEETTSNSGVSQTSYAPSLTDGGSITIPPPPKESAAGKPFECPYCFFLIEIDGKRSWTRHIFRDIKPYVCTLSDCSIPDRLFESRREWFFHITTRHDVNDLACPLCKDNLSSLKQFERHVARHLEELALFALPRSEMDEESDEDGLDAQASSTESYVALGSVNSGSSDEGYTTNDLIAMPRVMYEGEERVDIGKLQLAQASERHVSNLARLKELVDTNVKRCYEGGDPVSGEAVRKVYLDGLRNSRTGDLLLAVLDGTATLEQSAELDACVTQEHKIPFQTGIKPYLAPDVLYLRHRHRTYPLHFPAFYISEGYIKVGEVRRQAALATRTDDLYRIKLIYKGRLLKDDHRACKDESLKQNSEIMLVITEIGREEEEEEEEEEGQAEATAQTEYKKQRKGRDTARDLI